MDDIGLHILKKEDLGKYVAIGSSFFPSADWAGAPVRLGRMFDRWSEGILVVQDSAGVILGYYTLWPISKEAFEGFVSGQLKDEDMCLDRMPTEMELPHHYWILTAIALQPADHGLRKRIILKILADLDSRMRRNAPCHVLAHAATQDGHRFLTRTGFQNPNPSEATVFTLNRS